MIIIIVITIAIIIIFIIIVIIIIAISVDRSYWNLKLYDFLLKVHLNLQFDDIAFRFNVNKGTVCSHKPLSFSCTSKLNVIVIRNVY